MPRAIEALGWGFLWFAYAGVETPASLRLFVGLFGWWICFGDCWKDKCNSRFPSGMTNKKAKLIADSPEGNDRKKGKGNGKGECKSRSFASLRMTNLFEVGEGKGKSNDNGECNSRSFAALRMTSQLLRLLRMTNQLLRMTSQLLRMTNQSLRMTNH